MLVASLCRHLGGEEWVAYERNPYATGSVSRGVSCLSKAGFRRVSVDGARKVQIEASLDAYVDGGAGHRRARPVLENR